MLTTLPGHQRAITEELLKTRSLFVPASYQELAHNILSQFQTHLRYTISTQRPASAEIVAEPSLQYQTEMFDQYNYFYLTLPVHYDFHAGKAELHEVLSSVKRTVRHITVRFCGNTANAIPIIQFLEEHGFVFHGLQPLAWYDKTRTTFYDVFSMQWIDPAVLRDNAFPGHTHSVIHIYGYPLGVPGKMLRFIEKQLSQQGQTNGF